MDNEKEDRIRVRAYEIWQRTGRQDGSHLEHWDQATREIDDEDAERGSMVTEQVAGADPALAKHSKDASMSTPPKRGRKSAGAQKPTPTEVPKTSGESPRDTREWPTKNPNGDPRSG